MEIEHIENNDNISSDDFPSDDYSGELEMMKMNLI